MDKKTCTACADRNILEDIKDNISKYGFTVIGTSVETEYDFHLDMTYSIGIQSTYNLPDIIIFGLPTEIAYTFINMILDRMKKEGPVLPDIDYLKFAQGFPTRFKDISPEAIEKYMIQAVNYYQTSRLDVVQLIFPDSKGKWAHEDGCEKASKITSDMTENL